MRGVAEPRNLAVAITRRARGPSLTRNFSAGIGRGRGEGSRRYDDAEEPLFGASVGHGASRGGPLNAGFLGRGGSPGAPIGGFGSSSTGRGFNNLNQTHASETHSLSNGPLLSNISLGRGSTLRNQGEDPFSDAKPPARPSLNLGSGGFGRGKPVEKNDAPEDIFSSDRRGTLSSWSKWDQKLGKMDAKDGPSPAELRLMQDEESTSVLPFPAITQQQPGQWGQQTQASASPPRAAPPQQWPPGSPGMQPIQQLNLNDKAPPRYTGWQQPVQQPYHDASLQNSGWQQPVQQPYHDASLQPQPSMQYTPSPTGWQQYVRQPYFDSRFQPQPSVQYTPPPTGWQQQQPYYDARPQPQPSMQYRPPPTGWHPTVEPQPSMQYTPPSTGWQQPVQQSYYDARVQQSFYDAMVQPQPSVKYAPPPTALQPPASASPLQAASPQQRPFPGSLGRQLIQQPDLVGKTPPTYTAPSAGWQHPVQQPDYDARVQPGLSMQHTPPPIDWQRPVGLGEHYQQSVAQTSSSDYEFDKLDGTKKQPPHFSTAAEGFSREGVTMPHPKASVSSNSEFIHISQEERNATTPMFGHAGLDYDGKIEECFKQNKLEEIDDIYREMKAAKVLANAKTFGTILQSYLQLGKMDKVATIYQEMSGVIFPGEKSKDGQGKETAMGSSMGGPTPHELGGAASSTGTSSSGQDAQYGTKYEEDGEFPFSRNRDSLSTSSNTGAQNLASFRQPESSVGTGIDKGTSAASSIGSPILHQVGGAASFSGTSSFGQDDQYGAKYTEDGEFALPRTLDASSTSSHIGAQNFSFFGRHEPSVGTGIGRGKVEPSVGTGMGRGKKVDSFFNFNFSGGLGSSDQGTDFGKQSIQMDQESKTEVQDDYSQTFTPVIEPGWYAFAPEGLSVGPGAGRGRPQSPQARGLGLGSSPPQQVDSGVGQGSSSYEQRMQAALQQMPPRYSWDSRSLPAEPAEPDYDSPEEESGLAAEEAAERAMKILTEQRINKLNERFGFRDDTLVRRRSPLQLAQSLRERKQTKEPVKAEKEVRLTEEEEKKEAERLKAIEENEALQELHHTFDQFMKCYGEMALEPEHELGDFTNPDIEEKPFMPLEEYLEKAKPNIMKTGLIRGEKEWKDMVNETMRHLPYYEEFVEKYSGPGRYTAKQENEDLEEIANTLPSDVGRAAKAFVQRSLTTLKSNPGFNLPQKQWMLASMVDEFSQYIVND